MPILGSILKRQPRNQGTPEDLEAEQLEPVEPVEPEPSGPSLFLLAPSPGAANAFCLLKFRDAEGANEFAAQELPPSSGVNQVYGFWGLHGPPGGNGDAPTGEALVLIRDGEDANVVHPVSFVDFNSAFAFLRYEIRHGLNPTLVMLYWAALVTIERRPDGKLAIDCEPPAVNGAVPVAAPADVPAAAPMEQVHSYPGDEEKELAVAAAQDIVRIAEQAAELPPVSMEETITGPAAEPKLEAAPETVSEEMFGRTAEVEQPAAPEIDAEEEPVAETPVVDEAPSEALPIVDELPDAAAESEILTEPPAVEEQKVAEAPAVAAEEPSAETESAVAEVEAAEEAEAEVHSFAGDEELLVDPVLPSVFDDVQPEDVSVLGGADAGPGSGGWSGPDALQADISSLENSGPPAPEAVLSIAGDEETAPSPETSRPVRPAAVAERPVEAPLVPSADGGEEVDTQVDLAVEAQKLLKVRRWQTKEEPFKGFDSPPGKF